MYYCKSLIFSLVFLFSLTNAFSQDRFEYLETKLDELVSENPGLNEKVDLSVSDISIQEFVRSIGTTNNLNISVDPAINAKVVSNFYNITVRDILIYLCKNHNLDINFIGSIINIIPYKAPVQPPPEYVQKKLKIDYNNETGKVTLDLENDTLSLVTKELSNQANINLIFNQDLADRLLNGYIRDLPLDKALEKLGYSNNLNIFLTEDSVYQIQKKDTIIQSLFNNKSPKRLNNNISSDLFTTPGLVFNLYDDSLTFDISATSVSLSELIPHVLNQLKINYFLSSELKGTVNLKLVKVTLDEFLTYLLNGTDLTFKKLNGFYLFGERNLEGLRKTEVFTFKYRTVDKVQDFIPGELKKNVDLKMFPDLNSLILSGSQPQIEELVAFLRDIDRVVPVIQIEVLIVDVRDTKTLSSGIEAGIRDKPTQTLGTIYPEPNMSLGASSVNSIINGINGLGILNLGKVTANFYLNIKFLEQQGVLKLRSTPKLATLNGHEAKLSIGKTEYYLEVQSSVVGIQNPFPVQSQQYKTVNADLSVTINPLVSGDEQITLDITVKQSNFTERISQLAPPGTITRNFQSLIRVKNEEMIILGGLDENSTNDSGSGVPFFSRIPVIKWFFSSRTRTGSKNKLTIFIKPTVLY
jgi:type IV pilus assembly protein PilQ